MLANSDPGVSGPRGLVFAHGSRRTSGSRGLPPFRRCRSLSFGRLELQPDQIAAGEKDHSTVD